MSRLELLTFYFIQTYLVGKTRYSRQFRIRYIVNYIRRFQTLYLKEEVIQKK